jgi:hypothetical protein
MGSRKTYGKEKKEKITSVSEYRHGCEFINPMLIMVSHDTVWGVMPLLGGGFLVVLTIVPFSLGWEDGGLFVIKFPFV